jgi:putative addiction module killer protein
MALVIRRTDDFPAWVSSLKDNHAHLRIANRIDRLALENAGDIKPVGEGASELRTNCGPGYRVYFSQRGNVYILLPVDSDKSSQDRDIRKAKLLASEWKG